MDGSEFCCFYDRSDYDVCSVVVWAEIPDVIENKKVYSQVTDKEHKKLMKVLYPKKTTNKTNNVKKYMLLLALTMLTLLRIIEIHKLKENERLSDAQGSDSDKGYTTYSATYKSDGNLVRNIGGSIIAKAVNRQSKAVSFTYI
jgi:hypothetical protein